MAVRKGRQNMILLILVALFIGVIVGLSIMGGKPIQEPAAPVRETVVVTQPPPPPQESTSPFLYENTAALRRPPVKPFYVSTRGEPAPYQQVGILIGEERGGKGEQMILPLIGRQTYPGSSRYHYYASSNGYHPLKLPVEHKKRSCNDSTGCDEIFSGNLVKVKGYDVDFNADMYPSADPVYIL